MYDELLKMVERAEALLAATHPAHQWRDSVGKQLEYIREVATKRRRPARGEYARFTMGLLAAREFELQYPELATAIYEVLERFEIMAG